MNNAHVAAHSGSDKPSVAYLQGRVVRLAGGAVCPNCNRTLRVIDVVVGNIDLKLICWSCHVDFLCVESRN